METGHPSTRAVNSGSGNRGLQSRDGLQTFYYKRFGLVSVDLGLWYLVNVPVMQQLRPRRTKNEAAVDRFAPNSVTGFISARWRNSIAIGSGVSIHH